MIVTTGASEALHILFFDAAEAGANVVVSAPGFPPTWALPEALGLEVRSYRLTPERGFRMDVDEVARLVDANTRLVLVTSPHNPTGALPSRSEFDELVAIVEAAGGVMTTWTGGPCEEGGAVVACGDSALHPQVLEMLAVV